jgi:hypothetical protein
MGAWRPAFVLLDNRGAGVREAGSGVILRAVAFGAGLAVALATIGGAVRTVIVPRGVSSRLTRAVFLALRALFRLRAGPAAPYERRDRVMALYAPVGLLALLAVWMALVCSGFTLMFWGLGGRSFRDSSCCPGRRCSPWGSSGPGTSPR